jgi:hypothetical protein
LYIFWFPFGALNCSIQNQLTLPDYFLQPLSMPWQRMLDPFNLTISPELGYSGK